MACSPSTPFAARPSPHRDIDVQVFCWTKTPVSCVHRCACPCHTSPPNTQSCAMAAAMAAAVAPPPPCSKDVRDEGSPSTLVVKIAAVTPMIATGQEAR